MKKSLGLWQLIGFAVTSFAGTLLHFLYEWLNEPTWIAPFSGVNESTWEHMKLLFWPMLFFGIFQSLFFRDRSDFWSIKLSGMLLGLSLIPILYYTYNGVIGRSPDWINIAIFFVCAALTYLYELRKFNEESERYINTLFAILLLCLIALMFIIFTFVTPRLGIFKDPITRNYGI